jgi:hypothetical protein
MTTGGGPKDNRWISWASGPCLGLLLVLPLLGIALILYATPSGIGISSDSVAYVGAARNQAAGLGLGTLLGGGELKPLTHFPPLFPLLLAGLQLLGLDVVVGARLAVAFLFGANALLVGIIVGRETHSCIAAVTASFLLVTSPALIEIHTWAMSEPVFLFLGLTGIYLLSRYQSLRVRWLLLASALAIALAAVDRYVGLSLLVTGVLALLVEKGVPRRRKAWDVAILGGLSILPVAAWGIRNSLLTGGATNRVLVWHPLTRSQLKRPFGLLWGWVLPFKFTHPALLAMIGAALALIVAALVVLWVRRRRFATGGLKSIRRSGLGFLLLLYCAVYCLAIAGSISFLDASTPIDDRIASPVLMSLVVLVSLGASDLPRRLPGRWWPRVITACLVLALGISYVWRSQELVTAVRVDGQGYASGGWSQSQTLAAVRELPKGTVIYTNEPELVYFYTGRGSYAVSPKFDNVTQKVNPDYLNKVASMERDIRTRGGVLVLFDTIYNRPSLPSVDELTRDLKPLRTLRGGAIYGWAG